VRMVHDGMVTVVIKHMVPRISRKSISVKFSDEAAGTREEGSLVQNGSSRVVILMVDFRVVAHSIVENVWISMIRN
jgi:hypothetical protein